MDEGNVPLVQSMRLGEIYVSPRGKYVFVYVFGEFLKSPIVAGFELHCCDRVAGLEVNYLQV